MRRLLVVLAVQVISVTAFVASSYAALITFTHTGSGSGSIGDLLFIGKDFTITGVGDTDNRESFDGGFFIDHDEAWIAIDGVGTFNFLTGTRTFFNDYNNTPGFSRAGSGGLDLFNGPSTSSLDGWTMQTSIGPVDGQLYLMQWDASHTAVDTDGGRLMFNSGTSDGMFKAVVGVSVPDVSSTLLLFGCALVGFGGLRRKLLS